MYGSYNPYTNVDINVVIIPNLIKCIKGDIISDVSSLNITFPVTFYSWKAFTSFYFVKFCEGKLFSEVLGEHYHASNNFNEVP